MGRHRPSLSLRHSQLPADARRNLTVQKLLNIWQGEAANGALALSEAPILLAIQLNRFYGTLNQAEAAESSHSTAKDATRIILDTRIAIPCFAGDCRPSPEALTTRLINYGLHAVITHQGATAMCGHYRAFLTSGNLPRLQYFCDDGKTASCVAGTVPEEVMHHGYILLYLRCNP